MKTARFSSSLASVWLFLALAAPATPLSVTQGRAAQRAGTRLVDVYYDLGGGVPPYMVSLQGSLDGGTTWTLPVTTVTGHVGAGVTAGTNRLVTWNAGTDWSGQISANVKFRVNVTDSATPPAPEGFALIPVGSFQMGDQSSPLVGSSSELPVHSVYVSGFYMAKYEVSKAQWDDVATWAATNGYDINAAGASGKGTNHPAYYVTWYECLKWCNARSRKENLTPCYTVNGVEYKTGSSTPDCNWNANGYRLPTEAEWEKAARGGLSGQSGQNFPWGNTISHSQANYRVSSSNGTTNYLSYDVTPRPPGTIYDYYHPTYAVNGAPYTSPVGSFAPNGYGLYDMAGNLWEWCWDWHSSSYYATSPGPDPRGAPSGSGRVLRGGDWFYDASYCRVAFRFSYGPTGSHFHIGFRVARSSVP